MNTTILDALRAHNQEHILTFYNALDDAGKARLEAQLANIDWSLFRILEHREEQAGRGVIEPLGCLRIEDIEARKEEYRAAGLAAIRAGKVGAMLLAGGQGTRLGCTGPKGVFNIGVTHDLYIFEQLFQNTMEVVDEANTWIPFFIMTSDKNHDETVSFLKEHNYFGYNHEFLRFFRQDMAPSVDYDHKLLMEAPDRLALSPNGNGGWFSSLVKAGLLPEAKRHGIEWLNCFAVDNVLQKIADPCFIGAVITEGKVSGAKVVSKADPEERVGVLCLEDGKPSIVEYYEMTHDMAYAQDEAGHYLYNYGVILNYLFRLDKLEDILTRRLPLHIVEKKIPYIDPDGTLHKPETPNGYKFETLILDMIHMLDNCLSYEVVREHEFAPVKNKIGVDSVETARALLEKNGIIL